MIEKIKGIKSAPVDMDKSRVVVEYAHFGNVDRVGDIMTMGAAAEDLKARGPKGEHVIWHTDNHDYSRPVTKPTELIETESALRGVLTIWPNTVVGRDVYELYKSGLITHHSLGYYELEAHDNGGNNQITKIYITHVSNVMDPANFLSRTQSVDLKNYTPEEVAALMENMKKFIKDSIASDETIKRVMEAQKNMEALLEVKGPSLASIIKQSHFKI